jgi:dUTP pyrophosphatase
MELHIKAESLEVRDLYKNHTFAQQGDSGLDLFFTKDQVIPAKSTVLIELNIAAELREIYNGVNFGKDNQLYHNKSYWLLPRSSIYKTPLRQSNSIGLVDSSYK